MLKSSRKIPNVFIYFRYAVEWKTGQCEKDNKGYQVHKQIEVITEVRMFNSVKK